MTDDRPDHPAEDRASRAFREALHAQPADLPLGPPDLTAVRRRARRRSTLAVFGVAATVAALVGVTFAVTGERSTVQGPAPAADATTAGGPSNASPAPSTASPAPRDGWRYISYRDVELQVPQSWGYDVEPSSDWCVHERSLPSKPYVAREEPTRGVRSILCLSDGEGASEPPPRLWAPHVMLSSATGAAASRVTEQDGWTIVRERVGSALVTVTVQNRDLAEEILATAVVTDRDFNGCLARDPIQSSTFERPAPASDLAAIDRVDSISVCKYAIGENADTSKPGLISSNRLVGRSAAAELAALKAAPVGGGPDQPQSCVDDMIGDEAIVLWLNTGGERHRVHVYYNWCFHNGFDDGTTMRALTREACPPLIQPPILLLSGSSAPFDVCAP